MDVLTLFARFLSSLFHPVLLPLYAIFFHLNGTASSRIVSTGATIFLVLLPGLISIIYFKFVGIKNLFAIDLKYRKVPFILNFVGILCFAVFLSHLNYRTLLPYLFIYFLLNLLCLIISFFWKISLHMCGLGSVLGLLSVVIPSSLYIWFIPLATFSLALLAWSRYHLKAHDSMQLIAGAMLGWVFFGGATWLSFYCGYIG